MSGDAAVEANGVRLWTRTHGVGPPLVMLHGGPGLWDDFGALAAGVDARACVHRYDQRGGGRSADAPPHDLATFVADLEALRAHWGHERWTVCGHSFGVSLALAYAVRWPERVRALIGISGTGVVDDWSTSYHANANARLTPEQLARRQELSVLRDGGETEWVEELDREYCALTWAPDFVRRRRALELAAGLWHAPGPSYQVNRALNADWRRMLAEGFGERVSSLDTPVLLIHGADDPRPPRLSERLATALPRAELCVIADAGHWPWLEQPERVASALGDFLDRMDDEAPASCAAE